MLSLFVAFLAAGAADAPAPVAPVSPAPLAAAPAPTMVVGGMPPTMLRSGTPVVLKTTTNLTTKGKHLKVGDRFPLEVAEAVALNGMTVIPVGSTAVGEITSVRNKGMWGKSGNIETRLLYVTANDRKIRLSGSVGDKGVKRAAGPSPPRPWSSCPPASS